MSDRELLELAAKAAGVAGHWVERCPEDGYPTYTCGVGLAHWNSLWNPLTDDGDALRLAIKLRFEVQCYPGMGGVIYDDGSPEGGYIQQNPEAKQSDSEAVRRAIVRAAAKMGESLH